MLRPVALAVALVVLAACSEGAGSDADVIPESSTTTATASSPGCDEAAVAPGTTERTMVSGRVARTFQLTVPEATDPNRPMPVVLNLHALSVSFRVVDVVSGFTDEAARSDFIGVAPSGLHDGPTPYWLAAPADDNRDVRFVTDLLSLLERELCVDPARVYATGMSNGGQMSSLLACQLPDRVTAVAPIAGVEFSDRCRGRPVPVIAFHGTADPIVPYDGGGLDATTIADTYAWHGDVPRGLPEHRGVDEAMRAWAAHNGCDPDPVERRIAPHVRHRRWPDCEADTELYAIDGGGHAWPGRPVPQFEASFGPGTSEIDATSLMFDFFLEHRR